MHVCTTHVHTFLTRCTVRVLEVFYPLIDVQNSGFRSPEGYSIIFLDIELASSYLRTKVPSKVAS